MMVGPPFRLDTLPPSPLYSEESALTVVAPVRVGNENQFFT